MTDYKNYSAQTTYPNTPESDLQEFIMHTVRFDADGVETERKVMATDPLEAIRIVQSKHNLTDA
jgi:hypothetical protein